jgi:hypothetical protein
VSFERKLARRQAKFERKHPGIGGFRVQCREHGKKPWRGDLVCEKCEAIHLIDDETKEHPTIKEGACTCGVLLFPPRDENGEVMKGEKFYGRIACRDCARKRHREKAQEDKTI